LFCFLYFPETDGLLKSTALTVTWFIFKWPYFIISNTKFCFSGCHFIRRVCLNDKIWIQTKSLLSESYIVFQCLIAGFVKLVLSTQSTQYRKVGVVSLTRPVCCSMSYR
jgi:hypothetical protein